MNTIIEQLQPSALLKYNALFAQIEGIKMLTIGAPDFDVPQFVKDAGKKAIDDGFNGYAPGIGMPVVREAFARFLQRKYALTYDASEVITTCGLSQALPAVLKALVNANDGVIIPTPSFPQYELTTIVNGGTPILVDTSQTGFVLTVETLESVLAQHKNARFIILNYPSNPTGATYTTEQLQQLAKVIDAHDLIVISDEIYSELLYDKTHESIAKYIPQRTVLLNGMSKTYAMTGWRVGFIAVKNKALYNVISTAHQDVVPVSSMFTHMASATALDQGDGIIETMRESYRQRRNYLIDALTRLGFDIQSPDGAFYLFPKLPTDLNMDDDTFAITLAQQAKVGVIPGHIFGPGGENHVRISYAASLETLKESVARIEHFLQTYRAK